MRAGVLSDDQIITFLNENFINTWIPNSELGRVRSLQEPIAKRRERESKTFDTTHALAQAIMKGWKKKSPADSLVLSTEFELMGRLPVNERISPYNGANGYLLFLTEALDGKLPGFREETSEPDSGSFPELDTVSKDLKVTLTNERPKREVLNIFRAPGHGSQDYTVIEIDTTAFKSGGLLTIDILVGNAEPKGSFDLYDASIELPTQGMPHEALASAWDVPPGKRGTIKYRFDRGKIFKLGGTGSWFSQKGRVNAFWAKISVEPNQEAASRKVSPARPEQSAEDVMNTFVKAFKNLDGETILPMLTGDARETLGGDFTDVPEDMRAQISEMLSEMEILSSEYVGDEFHFRLKVPMAPQQEVFVKMQKVEGSWFIYDVK